MKKIFTLVAFIVSGLVNAQSPWPSIGWNSADNLTAIMDADGLNDLSGLHWNPVANRLYCVQNDGRLRVLQMDNSAMGFTQLTSKSLSGGPEGITQVNFSTSEFYVIDENNYEIQKYTHGNNFGNLTQARHWDLLTSPSPMEDTGNTGPEGIVFIPDSALSAAGFVSQLTGNLYTSTKGMGGLMFIAHQDGGFVWVFDLNPNVNNDFAFVGKYATNRAESCDLAFDRTTGMLYILHNLDANYLETTNLSTIATSGNGRKFITSNEYFIANPTDGNFNIEGFALMPKCGTSNVSGAWLCRDVATNEDDEILQDCLRWFAPFAADGSCAPPLSVENPVAELFSVYPNPGSDFVMLDFADDFAASVTFTNSIGQIVLRRKLSGQTTVDVSMLAVGTYFIKAEQNGKTSVVKWVKR